LQVDGEPFDNGKVKALLLDCLDDAWTAGI
jgi:hypothetical protein